MHFDESPYEFVKSADKNDLEQLNKLSKRNRVGLGDIIKHLISENERLQSVAEDVVEILREDVAKKLKEIQEENRKGLSDMKKEYKRVEQLIDDLIEPDKEQLPE